MSLDEKNDNATYRVVVNPEGLYSIWPADRENALGWSDAGKTGTKEECIAYLDVASVEKLPGGPGDESDETGGQRGDL